MKRVLSAAVFAVFSMCSATMPLSASAEGDSLAFIRGTEILAECVSCMPSERMEMDGRLTLRRRYGIEIKELDFYAQVDLSQDGGDAASFYEFRNLDGELVERVEFDSKKGLVRTYGAGGKTPLMSERIQGSDVTWLDVTFDYLRWGRAVFIGSDKVKGRECDMIDVFPPSGTVGFEKVRLWADHSQRVVMKAAQYAGGKQVRTMWVRAVQKLDDKWVLRDLEVETIGSGHRTRIHFDGLKTVP